MDRQFYRNSQWDIYIQAQSGKDAALRAVEEFAGCLCGIMDFGVVSSIAQSQAQLGHLNQKNKVHLWRSTGLLFAIFVSYYGQLPYFLDYGATLEIYKRKKIKPKEIKK